MTDTGLDGLGSGDLVQDYGVLGLLAGEGHASEGPEIGDMSAKLSVSEFHSWKTFHLDSIRN